MTLLLKIAGFLAISLGIYLGIALVLVFSQYSGPAASSKGLDFSNQAKSAGQGANKLQKFPRRDGSNQMARVYPGPQNGPLLVLLHGSGWHGLQFDALARHIQTFATVIAPDLRGHGSAPLRRGDVDYIGQLEDDLADLISATAKPAQKVILGGHSSGGGLVVRFAGGKHRDLIDGAILLAPFLKYNAPVTRPNSGGWAKPLTRRIIGLSMLNAIGIRALNGLKVIEFNMPKSVRNGPLGHTVTDAYSFRLNASYAPRSNYLKDVAMLPNFLLVAGRQDESFKADQYESLMSAVTDKGQYLLVEGVGHLDIVNAPETVVAIREFLE